MFKIEKKESLLGSQHVPLPPDPVERDCVIRGAVYFDRDQPPRGNRIRRDGRSRRDDPPLDHGLIHWLPLQEEVASRTADFHEIGIAEVKRDYQWDVYEAVEDVYELTERLDLKLGQALYAACWRQVFGEYVELEEILA